MCLLLLGCQENSEKAELNLQDQQQAVESLPLENESATESNDTDDSQAETSPLNESLVSDMGFADAVDIETNDQKQPQGLFCLDESFAERAPALQTHCEKIANRLASVSYESCMGANLKPSGCSSVNDFPILVSEFPPVNGRTPKGRVLVVGGIHGDELTSVSVTFRWIEKLNKFHSGLFHWHIAPVANPDGLLKKEATRTNENGVDINRNMPSEDWQAYALEYWQRKNGKDPRKFPGNSPTSEPETQWLVDEIAYFKPDAIISVHAPYGVVDFDAQVLNTAPKSLGKLTLNLLGTYPGSLGNYAGINRNIPVITLELPHAWEMPSEAETTKIWEDIVRWLKNNVGDTAATETLDEDSASPGY